MRPEKERELKKDGFNAQIANWTRLEIIEFPFQMRSCMMK